MFLLHIFPNISFPLCPATVDFGKWGISLYSISKSFSIMSAKAPNPDPSIIA